MKRIRQLLPSRTVFLVVLAVILASAGSATAAKLITSKQIKNGTIRPADLNRFLRSQTSAWFAKVDGSGTLLAGRHVTSVQHPGPGEFRVNFDKSVDKCAPVAAIRGTADNQFYGFVTTYTPGGNVVRVVIRNPAGAPTDGAGFNLVSTC